MERLDFRFTLQKRYIVKVVPYFDIGFPLFNNRIKLQADGRTKADRSFPGWRASSGRKALNKLLTKERVVSLASTKIQVLELFIIRNTNTIATSQFQQQIKI